MIHEATTVPGRLREERGAARSGVPSSLAHSAPFAHRVPRAPAPSSGVGRATPATAASPQAYLSVNPQPARRCIP